MEVDEARLRIVTRQHLGALERECACADERTAADSELVVREVVAVGPDPELGGVGEVRARRLEGVAVPGASRVRARRDGDAP